MEQLEVEAAGRVLADPSRHAGEAVALAFERERRRATDPHYEKAVSRDQLDEIGGSWSWVPPVRTDPNCTATEPGGGDGELATGSDSDQRQSQ